MRVINFYFTPLHPETGEEAALVNANTRDKIEGWVFKNPSKKVATGKSNVIKLAVDNEFTPQDDVAKPKSKGRKKTS